MTSFEKFLLSLDPDAGKRGKQFEHFVKWFLKNDPEWATQVDQVWLWDEYPDSWGRDCGIDLVFKHKNGENWAVQAKCYAPTTQITKADVDSFISESNRDGIDKRLLIATTDLIGANAKQVCDAQDKPVTRFLLSHFEDADIEYPATLDDLPKAKRKDKPKPRDHQIEAIEAVSSNFKDVDRGQLIMACGTGKTFTTLWIKEKLGVESTLVLLPSLGLLSQTLHEWTLAANEEFQVLCVCSDESVGKKSSDEAVHSISDLAFPVTSNAGDIKAFLNGSGKKVVFSTYQSSPLIAEAQVDKTVPAFDLAIADEAHRCAGKVSGDFSTILDGEKIRAKKRLFTTATPRAYSSSVKKAAEDRGVEVVGMDDEAVFGKQLFALNFGEAIKRGLLTDYRVVIIGVDDPTISAWIENRELLKADSDIEMDAESLAAQVGLLKAIKDYDLHRLISFHSRVSRAEVFSQDIHKVLGWIDEKHKPSGELKSDFVSGEMPTDKRRRKLSQLKSLKENQRGLLTNARCLSEGVDVPSLDGVAFIDPRGSQIDIIQAVGRAIRLSENKRAGTIILPVFIGKSDDPEQALEEGNFKPIWDVLNALKAHDDVLADELNHIRTELGRKGGSKVDPEAFSKISIDLPVGIDKSFGDGLKIILVEKSTESWFYWFGLLEKYSLEHGNCLVSAHPNSPDHKLGVWVGKQRINKNLLTSLKLLQLESLSGWIWNVNEEKWLSAYLTLKDFSSAKYHFRVPADLFSPLGTNIQEWISTQRKTQDILSSDRKRLLSNLEGWTWLSYFDEKWDLFFEALRNYSEASGDCLPPSELIINKETSLRDWIVRQRYYFDDLKDDQKKRLLSLRGWNINHVDKRWNENFSHLVEYISKHKDSQVPRDYKLSTDKAFGRWVARQRAEKSKLSQEQIKQFDAIPEWQWSVQDENWDKYFIQMTDFVERHGHCFVPTAQKDLYKWWMHQKSRQSDLSEDRKKRLESLKGWIWGNLVDLRWNKGFDYLIDYYQKNGNYNVPYKYKTDDGFKLGQWLGNMLMRGENLSTERINKLESLPNWVWKDKTFKSN